MGYSNRFSGAITITPPLTAAEVRQVTGQYDWSTAFDAHLRIASTTVQTDDGEATRYSADAIVGPGDPCNGYDVAEQIQTLVDLFGTGHEFGGFIQADWDPGFGEPPSRFYVRDGRVVEVKARMELAWPAEDGAS